MPGKHQQRDALLDSARHLHRQLVGQAEWPPRHLFQRYAHEFLRAYDQYTRLEVGLELWGALINSEKYQLQSDVQVVASLEGVDPPTAYMRVVQRVAAAHRCTLSHATHITVAADPATLAQLASALRIKA